MKVVFFGTPEFAADLLKDLIESSSCDVVAVVSKPDKPKGRHLHLHPTPVKEVALSFGIPLFQPEKASNIDFIESIKTFEPDLFVVASYGEIMKRSLLEVPRIASINVHTSLLPLYRGAAPIQRSIMDGHKETGVSIMYMVQKLDAGDVIVQEKVPILEETTGCVLEAELCRAGARALKSVFALLDQGEELPRSPQDESLVTYAKKILPEDLLLNWSSSAQTLHNAIRALSPSPGCWAPCFVRGESKRLKILESSWEMESSDLNEGSTFSYSASGWRVVCGCGLLVIKRLQLEGKKAMSIEEFVRGFSSQVVSFIK